MYIHTLKTTYYTGIYQIQPLQQKSRLISFAYVLILFCYLNRDLNETDIALYFISVTSSEKAK